MFEKWKTATYLVGKFNHLDKGIELCKSQKTVFDPNFAIRSDKETNVSED